MRRVIWGCIASMALATPATAAKFRMVLSAGPNQTQRMESGVAAVDSNATESSIRLIQFDGTLKKRASLQLIVMNQSTTPFNFGPENVTATIGDGTAVAIIGYDQLLKEEKRRQTWAAVAAGLAAAGNSMSAANAGYSRGTASYSGNTWGSVGTTSYSSLNTGTVSYSGYNAGQAYAAQSLANHQNQANFERMAALNSDRMEALKQNLRTTTVDPGQVFGGSVMFELPKAARSSKESVPVTFSVRTGGESHTFNVILQRQ